MDKETLVLTEEGINSSSMLDLTDPPCGCEPTDPTDPPSTIPPHNHDIDEVDGLQEALDGKENYLGKPTSTGMILASTIAGVRYWTAANSGGVTDHRYLTNIGVNSHVQLDAHVADKTSNPHMVTKTHVGLSNVDNTSDADKPLSNDTIIALDGKQDLLDSPTNNGQILVGYVNGELVWEDPVVAEVYTDRHGHFQDTGKPTYSPDLEVTEFFHYTLTEDTAIVPATNHLPGDTGTIVVFQDDIGNHSLSWDGIYAFEDGTPTIASAPNAYDVYEYYVISESLIQVVRAATMEIIPFEWSFASTRWADSFLAVGGDMVFEDGINPPVSIPDGVVTNIPETLGSGPGSCVIREVVAGSVTKCGYTDDDVYVIIGDITLKGGALESTAYMLSGSYETDIIDASQLNTSNVTDMNNMFYNAYATSIRLDGWKTHNVVNMEGLFDGAWMITELDVGGWDTSNVTNMDYLFDYCTILESIDISRWDTSKVTSMDSMFSGCEALLSLDVSGWDTSNVTDMYGIFADCFLVPELDVSRWNMSKVQDIGYMFNQCTSLISLDVILWDTSSLTSMYSTFEGINITTLDLSSLDTSLVDNMAYAFEATGLEELDLTGWDYSSCLQLQYMFRDSLNLHTIKGSIAATNPTRFYAVFAGCAALEYADLQGATFGVAGDMEELFSGCTALKCISNIDTTLATLTTDDFLGCISLVSPNAADQAAIEAGANWVNPDSCPLRFEASWDTQTTPTRVVITGEAEYSSDGEVTWTQIAEGFFDIPVGVGPYKVREVSTRSLTRCEFGIADFTDPSGITGAFKASGGALTTGNWMFRNLVGVTSLDISELVTEDMTEMNSMFSNLSGLTVLDVSTLDTSSVVSMSSMFSGLSGLTTLDVSGLDMSNVVDATSMFKECESLTTLNLTGFVAPVLEGASLMFSGLPLVTVLDVSGLNTSKVTSMNNMFNECGVIDLDLTTFDVSLVTDMNFMFRYCVNLNTLNTTGWVTGSLVSTNRTFFAAGTVALAITIKHWDFSNVVDMAGMFTGIPFTGTLDLGGLNTSLVTDFSFIFYQAEISHLILTGWTFTSTPDMSNMLGLMPNCVCITNLDTTVAIDTTDMFLNNLALVQPDAAAQASLLAGATWTNATACPPV